MAQESQVQKFKKAARDLGASDNEASFNKKLTKIGKAKPVGKLAPKPKRDK